MRRPPPDRGQPSTTAQEQIRSCSTGTHSYIKTYSYSNVPLTQDESTSPGAAAQLESLSQLHESVAAKILERTNQVSDRLSAWEDYRGRQDSAFAWLAEMERAKMRLDLRHLDADRIAHVLERIRVSNAVYKIAVHYVISPHVTSYNRGTIYVHTPALSA